LERALNDGAAAGGGGKRGAAVAARHHLALMRLSERDRRADCVVGA
jgi:hypothetical protein